jgi:hypothetical protein
MFAEMYETAVRFGLLHDIPPTLHPPTSHRVELHRIATQRAVNSAWTRFEQGITTLDPRAVAARNAARQQAMLNNLSTSMQSRCRFEQDARTCPVLHSVVAKVRNLQTIAESVGLTLLQLTVCWTHICRNDQSAALAIKRQSSVARNWEQLTAIKWSTVISEEVLQEIDRARSQISPPYTGMLNPNICPAVG